MRLKKEQVQQLSERIVKVLKEDQEVRFKIPDEKILTKIHEIILAEKVMPIKKSNLKIKKPFFAKATKAK